MLRHSTRTGTDLIVIARRHKWLIAGAMLVGVGAASVVNLTAKAVYQGEATVMVLSSRSIPGTLITVPGSASGRPAAIYNQIQVLTSRTLWQFPRVLSWHKPGPGTVGLHTALAGRSRRERRCRGDQDEGGEPGRRGDGDERVRR